MLVFTVDEATAGEEASSQREWLYKTIETRSDPKFAIDLGAINYMASSDIGVLITMKRRIDARKGKVAIFNVDPFIYDVLKNMRIDKLFTIVEDFHAATIAVNA